jgi:hypothetical protein
LNWVLICSKNNKKSLETQVKKPENLLGSFTEIPENLTEIFDNYNPHGVIIADFSAELVFKLSLKFREFRQTLKIFFLTEITFENSEIIRNLIENNIIISEKLDLENPMTTDEINDKIEDLYQKELAKEFDEIDEKKEFEKITKSEKTLITEVLLDTETLDTDNFNNENIHIIEENFSEQSAKKVDNKSIFIGLIELQHHIGCTHISFEIAEFLRQQGKNSCVILGDKETYGALSDYHKFDFNADNYGFEINKITIFPYEKLEFVPEKFDYIICDFGFLRSEQKKILKNAITKLCFAVPLIGICE